MEKLRINHQNHMNETPIETQAVVVREQTRNNQVASVQHALGVTEILAQVRLIQEVMSKVMTKGEHYGTIPGCGNKMTLLQPGAQKLTMTFRLAPEYVVQETNMDRGHKEYRVICTLKTIGSGSFAGQGVGVCSTMESKYRFHGGARKCPDCGKESIIKGKAEYGGGWVCFKKKGGCGAKWPDGAEIIEGQNVDKVENDNPADSFNTVLKMAKKRAFVDATITATAASDIFTQDIGDDETAPSNMSSRSEYVPEDDNESFDNATGRAAATKPHQDTTTPAKTPPSGSQTPGKATSKHRLKALNNLLAAPGQANVGLVEGYLRSKLWIRGEQTVMDFPLEFVPTTQDEMVALKEAVERFEVTQREEQPQ